MGWVSPVKLTRWVVGALTIGTVVWIVGFRDSGAFHLILTVAPPQVISSLPGHVPETDDGDGANSTHQMDQQVQDLLRQMDSKNTRDSATSDTEFN